MVGGRFSSQTLLPGERPQTVPPALLLVVNLLLLWFVFLHSKVGLNVLIQRANKFTPATRLLIQRFVPFPAVGKDELLFFVFQVVAANPRVARSHWDGHSSCLPARVPSVVVPELGRQGWDSAKQNFGRKMLQSCWWRRLLRLLSCAFHSEAASEVISTDWSVTILI